MTNFDDTQRPRRETGPTGPTPDEIKNALEEVESHAIPGTPSVSVLKTLRHAMGFPIHVGDRIVEDAMVRPGDPEHGAKQSTDNIGRYVVTFTHEDECDECYNTRARYSYRAYHNISGRESILCVRCDNTRYEERWG